MKQTRPTSMGRPRSTVHHGVSDESVHEIVDLSLSTACKAGYGLSCPGMLLCAAGLCSATFTVQRRHIGYMKILIFHALSMAKPIL